MSGDTAITLVGNLTADPELRFTQSGVPVADFTVASTPRIFDRASGEWKDGDALFLRCTLWRQPAENVAETLTKGARVIVTGRLRQRSYETREGEKRTVVEVDVEEIGPSLRYATARVTRAGKTTTTSHGRRHHQPAAVNTAAATRGPAPPQAGTTSPRSDPARARSGGRGRRPRRVPTTGRHRGRPRVRGAGRAPLLGSPLPGGVRRVRPVGWWVRGAEPAAADVAGVQGPRCPGVGDPAGVFQLAHQPLPEFPPPHRRGQRPTLRDGGDGFPQRRVDPGQGPPPRSVTAGSPAGTG